MVTLAARGRSITQAVSVIDSIMDGHVYPSTVVHMSRSRSIQ